MSTFCKSTNGRIFVSTLFLSLLTLSNSQCTGGIADNLIDNGDFSLGNQSFTSDYIYAGSTLSNTGSFGIAGQNPYTCPYNDHTNGTGKYFYADSSTLPAVAWRSLTIITLTPNAVYRFQAYLGSIYSLGSGGSGSPSLGFQISLDNMVTWQNLGRTTNFTTSGCVPWTYVSTDWTAPSTATTARIQLVNQVSHGLGNDFAVDDIYFGLLNCAPGSNQQVYVGPTFTATRSASATQSSLPSSSATQSALASTSASTSAVPSVTATFSSLPSSSATESAYATSTGSSSASATSTETASPTPSVSSSTNASSLSITGGSSSGDPSKGGFYEALHNAFNGAYELTISAIVIGAILLGFFFVWRIRHRHPNNNNTSNNNNIPSYQQQPHGKDHKIIMEDVQVDMDFQRKPIGHIGAAGGAGGGGGLKMKHAQHHPHTHGHGHTNHDQFGGVNPMKK